MKRSPFSMTIIFLIKSFLFCFNLSVVDAYLSISLGQGHHARMRLAFRYGIFQGLCSELYAKVTHSYSWIGAWSSRYRISLYHIQVDYHCVRMILMMLFALIILGELTIPLKYTFSFCSLFFKGFSCLLLLLPLINFLVCVDNKLYTNKMIIVFVVPMSIFLHLI